MASEKAYLRQDSAPGAPRAKSPGRSSKSIAKARDYTSDGVKDNDILKLPGRDWRLLGLLTVVAAVVRLFRIYQPSSVVFDEVHFGGFASKYIKGRFFMDVHPPLAKLLITLAGWLAGFDGNFEFKNIGDDYLEANVPYVAMRLLPAVLGVLTIPTMFLTLKAYGCKTNIAALGAGLVIFENGLLTQSRLILLDSPLVICTAFTALAWTCFTNQHEQGPSKAFTPSWWTWLSLSGLGLGATASVKWVGLFTIAWVGSLTILQLWVLLGDNKNVTPRLWFKHFFARVFCLIVIPITFYMGMFAIHFICLVNPGDGDGFMSAEFQSTLNNKGMQSVAADVVFGSRVTIRHWNTQGGYLHSHGHMYPTGSNQQQITLYPHKDENNVFLVENSTQPVTAENVTIPGPTAWDGIKPEFVYDGSIIRLYHATTDRRIHSHDVRAPITEADWQNEVSAYGYEGFEGDANDLFKVEIVPSYSDGTQAKSRLRTIESKFKLIHIMTGCTLFSHKVKLPDWGFEQQEVTCARGGTLPNSIWYIEQNDHPQFGAETEKVNYKNPGFFGKFWELQKIMWKTNAGLTESHAWDSRPPSWPILQRGINFWGKNSRQIYLMGNPVIWWTSTLVILAYVGVKGLAVLRWQRGYSDYSQTTFKRFDYEVGMTVLGWAFHYFPFYLMQRQLFLHHYLPALYFAIMALCQSYDFVTNRFAALRIRDHPMVGQTGAVFFLGISIFVFTLYAPLAYGNAWTKDQCKAVKVFEKWDWDCNNFHNTYEEYGPVYNGIGAYVPSSDAPSAPKSQEAPPPVPVQPQEPREPNVTPKAAAENAQHVGRQEKVEYRDEHGNILDEEQVLSAAAEGKVSFQTRYETRTRLVDEEGNEIPGVDVPEGVAPPHPDVEGQNPETAEAAEGDASEKPPVVSANEDETKEASAEGKEKKGAPRPASDAKEATKQ
ncbi:glycosyltransferase family 39 protein [Aplosporella prunicola CBS 121167]|uniref:Dolichyl-phosphate-mannose--protein mannosyltransferase n=1 Tax=Aplosporella prunicola CBS 121167 TaxID=1176127 RepID=A0A6A6BUA4_9PEZI|nr:glycosyltransferase family 39 protein [Aplosporella prunicola CBS 121167]KAF2146387.1 glycosyltransferase family 39 protein [Aplosporella prunicola CBS 121167]